MITCALVRLVLPTVLIGVISIAFDSASRKIKEGATLERHTSQVYNIARSWGEEFVCQKQMGKLREIFTVLNFDKIEDDADSFTLEDAELIPFLGFVCEKYVKARKRPKHIRYSLLDDGFAVCRAGTWNLWTRTT